MVLIVLRVLAGAAWVRLRLDGIGVTGVLFVWMRGGEGGDGVFWLDVRLMYWGDVMRRVFLVACVRKKQSGWVAARGLYVSCWFLKAREFVESQGGDWFILSAEHGLLHPDERIEAYEETLNGMRVAQRIEWAERVDRQIEELLPRLEMAVVLAGLRYREFLLPLLQARNIETQVPMAGLTIGKQLKWLGDHAK